MSAFRVPYTAVTISMVCLPYVLYLAHNGLELNGAGRPTKCFRDPNMTDPPLPAPPPMKPWSYVGVLQRVQFDHPTPGPLQIIGEYPRDSAGRKK
ncbi:unnamed protein product [Orchesella dallaii]|uniref:Uncharacterized protein n=1 Tax=Orchesella dallaii TaxID=48710 RepID=A0ABP1RDZ1_9HEXA